MTRKYEFVDEAAADAAIDLLRDEEGNELTPAIVSDVYAVDVHWKDVPNQEWQQYLVWPTPMGIHSFGSSSSRDEYAKTYCVLHPDSFYCNPPEPSEDQLV